MSPSFSKKRLTLWLVFGLRLALSRADSYFGAILQLDFGDETIATRIVDSDLHATVEIVAAFAHRKLDARIRAGRKPLRTVPQVQVRHRPVTASGAAMNKRNRNMASPFRGVAAT
jgi:hypothetical protein